MSFTIPMISFDRRSPEIPRMSVKLSERTLSVENSKVSAMQSTNRIAMASAIKCELMKLSTKDPSIGVSGPGHEKTHPNLVVNLSLFQAASVIHDMKLLSRWLLGAFLTQS
ncbi:hypothetical protein F2Q69_00062746 [Brassica cretica]|uniref:Uncharacterized protein n=1 Tax=Brassica cretica TaxID=69181 RepID=A0A8S9RIE3_BRACR|nr:hypothetical protein F2Q69_00062746 [Brassica cretica]